MMALFGRSHRIHEDELELEQDTEKLRESRKRDSKERKKERREKGHVSKEHDKLKHKERENMSGKENGKRDSRERGGSSRDRRKEDWLDGKDKAADHEHEKDRDKIREKDFGWSRHRESRDHEQGIYTEEYDKYKNIDHDRGLNIDRGYEKVQDRRKDRGREGKVKVRDYDEEDDIDGGIQKTIDKDTEQGKGIVEMNQWKDKGHERIKVRDKVRNKEIDKELERDRMRGKDRDRGKDREKERYKDKDREREKLKDREKEMDREKVEERGMLEKGKSKHMGKEFDITTNQDGLSARDGEIDTIRNKMVEGEENPLAKIAEFNEIVDGQNKLSSEDNKEMVFENQGEVFSKDEGSQIEGNSEGFSEIMSWVNRSRKLEKKDAAKEKVIALSRILDEQEEIQEEHDDEITDSRKDLAGVRVLHGLEKVMEGGAVVLTLKDQNILADGNINEDADILENVEIGEQKRRDEAYKAAKKTTGTYDDKFSEDLGSSRILPQYDDFIDDEGVTLDESGHFTGEAEKKLAELRKKIEGSTIKKDYEDLSSSGKVQSDYFTIDEMLQFKKPKKKKSLRRKERLDLDALEAEAVASGLGVSDLGTRNDRKRPSAREEEEKSTFEARINAYQTALAKAEEASKVLRQGQSLASSPIEYDNVVFGEDYEDLQKSLEQARKLVLRKPDETTSSGPQAVALLATMHKVHDDVQSSVAGDTNENKVVITEMEEFVLGLHINADLNNPESEDVFKDDEDVPMSIDRETKAEITGWTDAREMEMEMEMDKPSLSSDTDVKPDEIIHEAAVGKGLAGALKLLKDRGTLKESIDWGGRNMDKKKSKLVGINDNDGSKEIRIERTDEFGRIMTPKEAFRMLSHKFHGKVPGKMKLEKRMKQYQEDLKTKQMKASDTPLLAVEKMREAQERLKTPYLVLSGHVKPGQTSDPRSGFATVEKDTPGSLTPMLGDKKVEHFLGIKSKPEYGGMRPPPAKKPKT
ncbi:hypothetical protein HPP92_003039 [Vanilla planifolia]|uniref:SART-1 family protein DOT2 n=1 Tax=Vanilla planifolia TaxID=51239 RepID=A0A835SFQ3_VANPL|nr:hypothetical protein HPP92_003039 [Vanilla planifolia]